MTDPGVRSFIEKCIAKVSDRLPAKELLMDPFLCPGEDHESIHRYIRLGKGNFKVFSVELKATTLLSSHSDLLNAEGISEQSNSGTNSKDFSAETSRDFTVEGQRKDVNTIFLKLRIADSSGCFAFFPSFFLSFFLFFFLFLL